MALPSDQEVEALEIDNLVATRRSLHAVAESVIAGPQHRRYGTIRLQLRPAGFGGVALPVGVEGGELVWPDGSGGLHGQTCRSLASSAGLDAGLPDAVYPDGSGLGVDETLFVDGAAADYLTDWFATGDRALRSLAPASEAVLWPEHFDLAVTIADATYGVSPGDGFSERPYAYVSLQSPPAGALWNAPFGASRASDLVSDSVDLLSFFQQAKAELA